MKTKDKIKKRLLGDRDSPRSRTHSSAVDRGGPSTSDGKAPDSCAAANSSESNTAGQSVNQSGSPNNPVFRRLFMEGQFDQVASFIRNHGGDPDLNNDYQELRRRSEAFLTAEVGSQAWEAAFTEFCTQHGLMSRDIIAQSSNMLRHRATNDRRDSLEE